MGSLQDALLESGLLDKKKSGRDKTTAAESPTSGRKRKSRRQSGKSQDKPENPDLVRAYAARLEAERAEKKREHQAKAADQETRRRRNLKLDELVRGRVLNDGAAEIPRYFEHLGRVRRVLCTPQQRQGINSGALGIVSLRGRYLIVEPDVLEAYRAVAPDLVPDLSGREPAGEEGDYPPVPDELAW